LRRLPQRNHEQDQALRSYNSHPDTNSYTHANSYTHSHTNTNTDTHPYSHTHPDAYANTHAYSNPDSHANSNPDANAHAQYGQRCLLPAATTLPDTRAGSTCATNSRSGSAAAGKQHCSHRRSSRPCDPHGHGCNSRTSCRRRHRERQRQGWIAGTNRRAGPRIRPVGNIAVVPGDVGARPWCSAHPHCRGIEIQKCRLQSRIDSLTIRR